MLKSQVNFDFDTLKKILDCSFDEIYIVNAEGIVVYVNNACEKHYGVKASEIIGKSSEELSKYGLWEPRLSPLVLKTKQRLTIEQTTRTGKKLLTTATPIFDDEGNIEFVIENSRDITETEGLKHELEQSKKLLKRMKEEVKRLRKTELDIPDFICKSKKMESIIFMAKRIAQVDSPVLILGESGTGKGMLAKFIHKNSNRKNGPFITLNCASIPPELFEAELFGYEKGAFTGASEKGKMGLIDLAAEGTLFLDEIGDLPFNVQTKLLHILQEGEYFKIGGREVQKARCRFIAATNRNLREMIKNKTFREDLYYRLSTFEIELPPLRERKEEIIPLAQYFLEKYNKKYHTSRTLGKECLNQFLAYSWPGNVRELENVIERLVVISTKNTINNFDIPFNTIGTSPPDEKPLQLPNSLEQALADFEKELITRAYQQFKSSYKVAKALKISQSKANRLIRKYCSKSLNK